MKAKQRKFKRLKIKDFNELKSWALTGLQWDISAIIGCIDQPGCEEVLHSFQETRRRIKEL